jgi:hypothetical protein
MSQDQESIHKSALNDLREKGHDTVYYRDIAIEPTILPLVELLNNEWSLTTHSCGGHWTKPPRFQYPYVQFRIFRLPAAWGRIESDMFRQIAGALDDRLTLEVHGGFLLPEKHPAWRYWRFRPVKSGTFKHSREVFRNASDFRASLKRSITTACYALDQAMEEERKRYGRRFRVSFSGAFKYQLKAFKPLTEVDLRRKDMPKRCHLSGRPFREGDTILYVCVPATDDPSADYLQVAARKSVLEKQDWKYYPVTQESPVPRVVLEEK